MGAGVARQCSRNRASSRGPSGSPIVAPRPSRSSELEERPGPWRDPKGFCALGPSRRGRRRGQVPQPRHDLLHEVLEHRHLIFGRPAENELREAHLVEPFDECFRRNLVSPRIDEPWVHKQRASHRRGVAADVVQYWSSRPDLFTVASKNSSMGSSRPPHVFHTSAYRAATLSARSPLAAIVIGGRGTCTHPGAIEAASYRVKRPANGVTSPRRRRSITAAPSASRATRSPGGISSTPAIA